MIYRAAPIDDYWLTEGVLARRVFAWLLDVLLIGLILAALWFVLLLFGVLTLGLGLPLLGGLPFVPFCYHLLFVAAPASATPGQQALGLVVRRNDDLGRPTPVQAFIYTLLFYVTLATTGLLLLFALFTLRHRTLHDLASGLVVVRARALTGGLGSWNMQGGSPYA
ncbi:MAG TPA: RDD family protein [Acetobacteraceae bacterium]|nr:RDD family protein [Acetobacteraceae bacterium]